MGGTLGNTLEAARHYHEQGYRPVPIPAKTKGPRVKDWPNYQFDAATSPRDFPIGSNIGIIMGGGLVCVDFDHERALVIAPTSGAAQRINDEGLAHACSLESALRGHRRGKKAGTRAQ